MPSFTITIPHWHPTPQNAWHGTHWAVRAKAKKADREMIAVYFWDAPVALTKRRLTLTIVLAPGKRGGDPDCYWKSLLDGLSACGALVDDNRKWVELMPVVYERGDAVTWGSRITLEDIE